jgi:lipopolysaccharide/colanic/teichoic acid biosynthesis glycosyltransferase
MLSRKLESQRIYLAVKRFSDICISCLSLIILFPLFILIIALIKFDDPNASVLFRQKRVGKRGKTFYIYKFRSMVPEAEQLLDKLINQNETTGAMFKMKDDPRVTRIGHILRKTSLDELPQLINVIRGEMSLVGPRPPLPREVEKYSSHDLLRLAVTPGCTGLWQVSGRSTVGFDEMVALDLQYIHQRNFRNDLKIIMRTCLLLMGSKNAY